jgi:uncharacterized paraquat-inducible protein A
MSACPKCGSKNRHQELTDPCADCEKPRNERDQNQYGLCWDCNLSSISFLVCEDCGFKEYDD